MKVPKGMKSPYLQGAAVGATPPKNEELLMQDLIH